MEKRTLLAVALSMLVMIGFFVIQSILYPPPEPGTQPAGQEARRTENVTTVPSSEPNRTIPVPEAAPEIQQAAAAPEAAGEIVPLQDVVVETGLIKVILTNSGGNITSFRLKKHFDNNEPVEMILAGNAGPAAFGVAFGNRDDVIAKRIVPVERNFRVRRVSDLIVEFSQDFGAPSGGVFTMVKRYEFKPDEYMFELTITLNGGNSINAFNFQGAAYTLVYGPQIGPRFVKLDQRYERKGTRRDFDPAVLGCHRGKILYPYRPALCGPV